MMVDLSFIYMEAEENDCPSISSKKMSSASSTVRRDRGIMGGIINAIISGSYNYSD